MIHLVEFFTHRFGAMGNIASAVVFLALAVLGLIIAMRGRAVMVGVVAVCGFICGALAGAMIGLLCFNSIILMVILASVGGVLLLYTVKNIKSVGYFIGIGSLTWFLAFTLTSQMYVTDEAVTENTLLFIDLAAAVVMGILAACRSKYIVSVITAISGGVITAISSLAILGYYFADLKTWIIAGIVAAAGIMVQINVYDLKGSSKKGGKLKKKKRK